jgi:hypothetical protein
MRVLIQACLVLLSLSACATQDLAVADIKPLVTVEQLMADKAKYNRQLVRLKARVSRSTDFCFIRPLSGPVRGQPIFWYWGADDQGDCQANPNVKYGIAIVEGIYKAWVLGRTYSEDGVIDNATVIWLEQLTADEWYAR